MLLLVAMYIGGAGERIFERQKDRGAQTNKSALGPSFKCRALANSHSISADQRICWEYLMAEW